MLTVYPYGSGSLYTASYATTASVAGRVEFIAYVISASNAQTVLFPESGSQGINMCLLTTDQYLLMISTGRVELCEF